MAGRGPAPKPEQLRQRRNRKPGAATLPKTTDRKVPPLPSLRVPDPAEPGKTVRYPWHTLTRKWWRRIWTSPMASQWLDTDVDGLGRLALLVDRYYQGDLSLASEIRLQEARWGLTPVDRQRLQWTVERPESGPGQEQRPQPQRPAHSKDPRGILGVVK